MDGLYKFSPETDCSVIGGEMGALKIEDGVFYGAESQCRMQNPVNVRDMDAQLFDMNCSGEGALWQERALVMRGADNELILVWNGYAFAYERCPDPQQAEAATGQ